MQTVHLVNQRTLNAFRPNITRQIDLFPSLLFGRERGLPLRILYAKN